jgi:S1-C subfamily serine protease
MRPVEEGRVVDETIPITPALATSLNLPQNSCIIISDVLTGGSAEAAGARIQDIIASVDGTPVNSVPYFGFRMMIHGVGDNVHIEVCVGLFLSPLISA